jgi:hypothetical protein
MTSEALHELIDRIPESEIVAAQRVLEQFASEVSLRAAMSAPPDDEPVTARETRKQSPADTFRLAGWFLTTGNRQFAFSWH